MRTIAASPGRDRQRVRRPFSGDQRAGRPGPGNCPAGAQ